MKKLFLSILFLGIPFFSVVEATASPEFRMVSVENISSDSAVFVGDFDSHGSYESYGDLPLVWFEYGEFKNDLDKQTMSIPRVAGHYPVKQRIYYELNPDTRYFVRTAMEFNGEKSYGDIISFRTKKGNAMGGYSQPLREYHNNEDNSKIEFDDEGKKVSSNGGFYTLSDFWKSLKSSFSSSEKDKGNGEESAVLKQAEKTDDGLLVEKQDKNGKEGEHRYNPKSAEYDDERGEIVVYNTQYRKYYNASRSGSLYSTRNPIKKKRSFLSYIPLILLIVVLFFLINFFYVRVRRRRTYIPPIMHIPPEETPRRYRTTDKVKDIPVKGNRFVPRKTPQRKKYEIPHRDFNEVRKDFDSHS